MWKKFVLKLVLQENLLFMKKLRFYEKTIFKKFTFVLMKRFCFVRNLFVLTKFLVFIQSLFL